ncbi:MAG TPA: glutamate synthase subunit beta [Cyclobacteriaceae bacterium]|nr:glutamate synthase subunit beta [Cyclobacteriaceae bacterium]
MGKPTGFLEYPRELPKLRDPKERVNDYQEFYIEHDGEKLQRQSARCMDCGIPFCHSGCPLGNNIPEFNDAVYREDWPRAYEILNSTNNFPEFTGRICPAPCESSCVLGINKPPVTIEYIEKEIIEKAFDLDLVRPNLPKLRTGKKAAVVGSGPAGLAAASQLNKAGHWVTVFERSDRIGGLLRYGIPDFKLDKKVLDRRLKIMEEEGIVFKVNSEVGKNVNAKELLNDYDAIILCGGSTEPRDLNIPGRDLKGIYFAMDFLRQQNKRVAGDRFLKKDEILATDKNVIVIGGGDTGSDCVGTSNRHGARSVTQFELLPKPPADRSTDNPWPQWPLILRTSSSHEEGCDRYWSILTKTFTADDNGNVKGLVIAEIEWVTDSKTGKLKFNEIPGTEKEIPCDLALLAIGFEHPEHDGVLDQLKVGLDERGNVKDENYQTNIPKVFTAGDMRRGQSLVVWAISEGREAARATDKYLMNLSMLEGKNESIISIAH